MKVNLRKFFAAFDGGPHQLAAIELLADAMPSQLLEKNCEWISCFEVDGEVDPEPNYPCAKGYKIKTPG